MDRSTDQTTNRPYHDICNHDDHNNNNYAETNAEEEKDGDRGSRQQPPNQQPGQTQAKRSSSWSHRPYNIIRPSLPNRLHFQSQSSRQAREQQQDAAEEAVVTRVRDKHRDRKSIAFSDEALINSSNDVGDEHLKPDFGSLSASKPGTPRLLELRGIASTHNDKTGYLPQQPIRSQPLRPRLEMRSADPGAGPDLRGPLQFRPGQKFASCAQDIAPFHPNSFKRSEQSFHEERKLGESTISQPRNLHANGPSRRKIMRTVSQDDYLVARGANPRTGIITPSIHSGSSSMDEKDWKRIQEMSQPAQWRLKGDEWVSQSLDEPDPMPRSLPDRSIHLHRGRVLRTPPKLSRGRPPGDLSRVPCAEGQARIAPGQRVLISSQSQPKLEQGEGAILQARLSPDKHEPRASDTVIRRKPLGTQLIQPAVGDLVPGRDQLEGSTETVITKPGHADKSRSSSMPTPQKFRYFKPEDVGKELPPLPHSSSKGSQDAHGRREVQKRPFLGLRPGDWIEDVPSWISRKASGPERDLPCLPMKDIRFRSHQSTKPYIQQPPVMNIPSNTANIESRQISTSSMANGKYLGTVPCLKPSPPPRRYHSSQAVQVQHRTGPRGEPQMTPALERGQRRLECQEQPKKPSAHVSTTKAERETGLSMETGKPTITPTTIPTTIPTTTPITIAPTPPEDTLVSWSWREIPSPPSARRGQRERNMTSCASVPGRAKGTHNVPRASPQKEASEQHQRKATGTSNGEISAMDTGVDGGPERDLIPRALRPSNGNKASLGRRIDVVSEDPFTGCRRMKTCQCCQGCTSVVKQRNMHGSTHMRGDLMQENTELKSGGICAPSFSQAQSKDHADCCPDCCMVGCHGSCLGHSSPSGGTAHIFGVGDTFGAGNKAARKSIRLSRRIRVRRSAGGSHETETEEIAELETPMAWVEQESASPGMPCKSGRSSREQRVRSSVYSITNDFLTLSGMAILLDAAGVRFAGLRRWLDEDPRLPRLPRVIIVKLLDMSIHVAQTTYRIYQVVTVYSESGILDAGSHASLVGLGADCVKAVMYSLLLTAVGIMAGRLVLLASGVVRWLLWSVGLIIWIARAAGLGLLW